MPKKPLEKQNYSDMRNEELLKKLKTTNLVTGILVGAFGVSLFLNIFVNKKSFWGIVAVPLCLSPIVLINYNVIKDIKAELKSRNN